MIQFDSHRFRWMAAIGAAALSSSLLPNSIYPAHATGSGQALLARALHNTNTVRTLVHTDKNTITAKGISVSIDAHGSEDEVQNREQDYESVTLKVTDTNGKTATRHYTVDIIFMNGLTYFRTSASKGKWTSRKGMTFSDPYSLATWKRERTKVECTGGKFSQVGSDTSHFRCPFTNSQAAGTVDVWISGGSTPYVVREEQVYHLVKGTPVTFHDRMTLGPLNQPLNIQPPTSGSA